MAFRCHLFLITFDMEHGFAIRSIGHGCDHTAHPVEVLGGDFSVGSGQVAGCRIHVRVERSQHIKCIGCKRNPFQNIAVLFHAWSHLDQRQEICTVHTDRTECSALFFFSIGSIWIIRGSLIMGGQYIFHILYSNLFFRNHAPWQIIRIWSKFCIYAIPDFCLRIQVSQHIPCTRSIINMVGIVMASKGISGGKTAASLGFSTPSMERSR